MKTKFMYVGLAAMMLAGLNSCSNDDNNVADNGDAKSVYLKFTSPETRADEATQGATTVAFASGRVYFVTAAGVIAEYCEISGTPTNLTSTPKNLNVTDLLTTGGGGVTVADLPGSVSAVHVVGNTPIASLPTSGSISAVQATLIDADDQAPLSGSNLYGSGTATLTTPGTPGVTNDLYSCTVTIYPTLARIELPTITGTGAITGFTVEGIYVDGFYEQADVDGTVNSAYFSALSSVSADFVATSTKYASFTAGTVYDEALGSVSAAPYTVSPSSAVWGYNVFAESTGSDVPRIVIRLSGVTATGYTFIGDQFITVKNLLAGSPLAPLATISSGNVYNIAAGVTFDETHLAPQPNLNLIDVAVDVTLVNWVVQTVVADI